MANAPKEDNKGKESSLAGADRIFVMANFDFDRRSHLKFLGHGTS